MNHSDKRPQQKQAGFSRLVLPWLTVFIWALLIFYFSAQPSLSSGLGIWDTILRKAAHMMEFGVLCVFLWRAIRQHGVRDSLALAAGAVIALLYAASDEFHQSFVSGRAATLRDVGFDLSGILIAVVLIRLTALRKDRSRS